MKKKNVIRIHTNAYTARNDNNVILKSKARQNANVKLYKVSEYHSVLALEFYDYNVTVQVFLVSVRSMVG